MRQEINPPVFICGCPRSGTTFFYHLLLSSGGFAIYRNETRVFDALGPRFVFSSSAREKKQVLGLWFKSEHFRRFGVDPVALEKQLMQEARTPGQFLSILMLHVCVVQGAERWAECSPVNILYLHEIMSTFPTAKVIHIVRDGRDVAVSLSKKKWIRNFFGGKDGEVYSSAIYWSWMVKLGLKNAASYPKCVLQVKYENLIGDMQSELTRIGEFIEYEFDIEKIYKGGIGSVLVPNTSFESELENRNFCPIGRWKKNLSGNSTARLEHLIKGELLSLGYTSSLTGPKDREALISVLKTKLILARFSANHWRKRHLKSVARKAKLNFMNIKEDDAEDLTFRPNNNLDYIRSIVGATQNLYHD